MSEKITFAELVEKISAKTDRSEQTTNDFIHELAKIIETSLGTGEKISISGFGKFELRWIDQRKGRNPQTGEEITIPGQNKVVFKPYKALRERVNKPFENLDNQIIGNDPSEDKSPANAPVLSYSASSSPSPHAEAAKQERPEEDLIVERESPVESGIRFDTDTLKPSGETYTPSPQPITDDEDLAWVFEQKRQHQNKMAKEVQSNGSYRWSYTAAAIIVLIAIFLYVFILSNGDETTSPDTTSIPAQTNVEQTDNYLTSETETQSGIASRQPETSESDAVSGQPPVPGGDIVSDASGDPVPHTVSMGESLWSIAGNHYGDPFLWPLIYEANQDALNNPNLLIAGNSIQLPSLNNPENLSQNERKMVALGYISVYDWILENQPDNARYYLWAAGSFSQEVLRDASENVNEADLAFATQG